MGRLEEKTRYLTFGFPHNVLALLVNISFSFLKFVRIVCHGLFHSKQSHEFTVVYPSLLTKSISLSRMSNFSLDPSAKTPDIKR